MERWNDNMWEKSDKLKVKIQWNDIRKYTVYSSLLVYYEKIIKCTTLELKKKRNYLKIQSFKIIEYNILKIITYDLIKMVIFWEVVHIFNRVNVAQTNFNSKNVHLRDFFE